MSKNTYVGIEHRYL